MCLEHPQMLERELADHDGDEIALAEGVAVVSQQRVEVVDAGLRRDQRVGPAVIHQELAAMLAELAEIGAVGVQHRGEVYGLVAPLWEQAVVLADQVTGTDTTAAYFGVRPMTLHLITLTCPWHDLIDIARWWGGLLVG